MKINLNGNEIRGLRKRLKLTQQIFAESVGITHNYLSDIERGKKIPSDILNKSIQNKYIDDLSNVYKIKESQATFNARQADAVDRGRVINEVMEILESGNVDVIEALVKNVREFKRAVNTAEELNSCLENIKALQNQIDVLNDKVNRLTSRPDGAVQSGDSSE